MPLAKATKGAMKKELRGGYMGDLTTSQAAQRLGVTERSVQNYIKKGHLPARKAVHGMDWKYMIAVVDLEAFARTNNIELQTQ
jgi:excisionase family DNA binding protein